MAASQAAGAGRVFREMASGTQTDRAQLRKAIAALDAGDVLMVTRLGPGFAVMRQTAGILWVSQSLARGRFWACA